MEIHANIINLDQFLILFLQDLIVKMSAKITQNVKTVEFLKIISKTRPKETTKIIT